jgi:hypothetical protein
VGQIPNDPIIQNIKRIDTSIRGLRKYSYLGPAQDHLYHPDYVHRDSKVSCDECGCDSAQRVQRAADDEDDDGLYVVVHRGTIASGELVIKNGKLRDELAKQYGILCFEMEAAGAMANFPCIVIRSISDYSDSHKNDQWHGYAAVAAAAHAREHFFHMPGERPSSEPLHGWIDTEDHFPSHAGTRPRHSIPLVPAVSPYTALELHRRSSSIKRIIFKMVKAQ